MVVSSRAAAGAESTGIVYVAVELSQHGWLIAVQTPRGNGRASKHRLRSGDADGLLDLIGRIRAKGERATGGPVRAACCYGRRHCRRRV